MIWASLLGFMSFKNKSALLYGHLTLTGGCQVYKA
nr:MAG TPA: hypothetical protein [Caudoviricetes sp.]